MSSKHVDFGSHYPNVIEDSFGNPVIIYDVLPVGGFLQNTLSGVVSTTAVVQSVSSGSANVTIGGTAQNPTIIVSDIDTSLAITNDASGTAQLVEGAPPPISVGTATIKSLTAGTAIGMVNGANTVTVNNTGVTSAVAGSGVGVSSATGAVTFSNIGVLSNVAGTGIGVSGATGNVTVSNTGVTSNVAGSGISVSGPTGAVTISNTGVTSAVAGTGIGVSGATGAVTISNSGVTSIIAGTNISVSGATGAVTVNNTAAAGITSIQVDDTAFVDYLYGGSGTLYRMDLPYNTIGGAVTAAAGVAASNKQILIQVRPTGSSSATMTATSYVTIRGDSPTACLCIGGITLSALVTNMYIENITFTGGAAFTTFKFTGGFTRCTFQSTFSAVVTNSNIYFKDCYFNITAASTSAFSLGSLASTTSGMVVTIENCEFDIVGNNASSTIALDGGSSGSGNNKLYLKNNLFNYSAGFGAVTMANVQISAQGGWNVFSMENNTVAKVTAGNPSFVFGLFDLESTANYGEVSSVNDSIQWVGISGFAFALVASQASTTSAYPINFYNFNADLVNSGFSNFYLYYPTAGTVTGIKTWGGNYGMYTGGIGTLTTYNFSDRYNNMFLNGGFHGGLNFVNSATTVNIQATTQTYTYYIFTVTGSTANFFSVASAYNGMTFGFKTGPGVTLTITTSVSPVGPVLQGSTSITANQHVHVCCDGTNAWIS